MFPCYGSCQSPCASFKSPSALQPSLLGSHASYLSPPPVSGMNAWRHAWNACSRLPGCVLSSGMLFSRRMEPTLPALAAISNPSSPKGQSPAAQQNSYRSAQRREQTAKRKEHSTESSALATQRPCKNQSNPFLQVCGSKSLQNQQKLKTLKEQRKEIDKEISRVQQELEQELEQERNAGLSSSSVPSPYSCNGTSTTVQPQQYDNNIMATATTVQPQQNQYNHSSTAAPAAVEAPGVAALWEGPTGSSKSSSHNGTGTANSDVDVLRSTSPDEAPNGRPAQYSSNHAINGQGQQGIHNPRMLHHQSHPPAPEEHANSLIYRPPPKSSSKVQEQPSSPHTLVHHIQQQQQQHQHQQHHHHQREAAASTAAADAARKEEVLLKEVPHDICVVQDGATARKVVDYLIRKSKEAYTYRENDLRTFQIRVKPDTRRYFACDTEVAYIDIKSESPVGHGCVNCFSIYCGDDIDFREALAADTSTSSTAAAPDSPTAEHALSPSTPATTNGNASSSTPATTNASPSHEGSTTCSSTANASSSTHEGDGSSSESRSTHEGGGNLSDASNSSSKHEGDSSRNPGTHEGGASQADSPSTHEGGGSGQSQSPSSPNNEIQLSSEDSTSEGAHPPHHPSSIDNPSGQSSGPNPTSVHARSASGPSAVDSSTGGQSASEKEGKGAAFLHFGPNGSASPSSNSNTSRRASTSPGDATNTNASSSSSTPATTNGNASSSTPSSPGNEIHLSSEGSTSEGAHPQHHHGLFDDPSGQSSDSNPTRVHAHSASGPSMVDSSTGSQSTSESGIGAKDEGAASLHYSPYSSTSGLTAKDPSAGRQSVKNGGMGAEGAMTPHASSSSNVSSNSTTSRLASTSPGGQIVTTGPTSTPPGNPAITNASKSSSSSSSSSSSMSQSSTPQRRLWVDVWPEVEKDEHGKPLWKDAKVVLKKEHPIIAEFKRFFEDDSIAKVWHNYGFDRHVMANLGVECQGFMGDTLHMARLADASRSGKKNYSLESLTSDVDIISLPFMKDRPLGRRGQKPAGLKPKKSMKERFGQRRIMKDGKTEGKLLDVPPIHVLHEDPKFRPTWVEYSARDAETTWLLREALYRKLKRSEWRRDTHLVEKLQHPPQKNGFDEEHTLYEFYQQYWIPFGLILTDMEKYGMMINREHLRKAQEQAQKDRDANLQTFLEWAKRKVPDAEFMNAGSGSQIRQLLFPEHPGLTAGRPKEPSSSAAPYSSGSTAGPGEGGASQKKAASPKPKDTKLQGCRTFKVPRPQHLINEDISKGIKRPKKHMDITLHSIWGPGENKGQLIPEVKTATGAAAVSIMVLKSLSGKAGAARKALEALKEEELRMEEEMLKEIESAVKDQMNADEIRREKLEEKNRQFLPIESVPMPLEDEFDTAEAKLHASVDMDELGNRSFSPELEEELALAELEEEELLPDLKTSAGAHQVEHQVTTGPSTVDQQQQLRAELENEAKARGYGKLYAAMGGGKEGLEACVAIEALCEVSAIDKLLTAFIIPLQGDNISTPYGNGHRIHCSLNINTETGRLSARRPNLQNQPALEKDRYKVRQAFTAYRAGEDNGNTLVVADYGQLELRILAHVADCHSMKEAFILGGDFHSRTAYGMYDEIQADIAAGNSYLEWEGEGAPDKPLLKDKFASERRKAKILNFSIAYGKTAFGLAKDFGTTLEEAQQTVDRWYADRKEVLKWQVETTTRAKVERPVPFVSTLLGRTRPLPDLNSKDRRKAGHAQRASINTPIQGSAADVASSAMLAIDHCKDLEQIGWRLVMQVHDEVILEGPKDTAQQAKDLVVKHMAHPWAWAAKDPSAQEGVQPLRVELAVDANTADTWYDAK